MIPTTMTSLEELWEKTRRAGLRMLVHRQDRVATSDSVFILEVLDENGATVAEVTTKNLESAARFILDQKGRKRA
jgi:hypothetical protein